MFSTLFTDSKFSKLITVQITGVLYVILAWLFAIVSVAGSVIAAIQGELYMLVLGPIVGLLSVVVLRLLMEAGVALVKIAENTARD